MSQFSRLSLRDISEKRPIDILYVTRDVLLLMMQLLVYLFIR